ncbi:MAG: hydrogenase assembly protein HupF [Actinomycetota bacterium]|nr:hydrogenase assembly protein HupF [Actinomycetota bacterium]
MTSSAAATSGPAFPAGDLGELATDLSAASLALARSFAGGATMWCCSPRWPHHARHVAVEFVHPVIVGKRALPALIVPGDDLVANLRVSVRPGDIIVAVADAHDPAVGEAMRRARAWGVETVWIGAGPRPERGAADHVIWLTADEALASYDGRFIFLYHVLWELTHVCFEHPGLLSQEEVCEGEVCVTCSDEGRLGEVVRIDEETRVLVRTPAGTEPVDTDLVGPVEEGDLLVIHAGAAITRLER